MYQWIVDNGMTPHLLVDANTEHCSVPRSLVNDGKIVLNIAPMAINSLVLGDEEISFGARFNGKPDALSFLVVSVLAIYARENGQGMVFSETVDAGLMGSDGGSDPEPDPDPEKPRSKLKVVK